MITFGYILIGIGLGRILEIVLPGPDSIIPHIITCLIGLLVLVLYAF